MQAGRLDRFITIQRKTSTLGDDGQPVDTWAQVGVLRRPATAVAVRGGEGFDNPQFVAKELTQFWIRWSEEVEFLSPLDRIIYPALTDDEVANSPSPDVILVRRLYDIQAVHETGRHEGLKIVAERRSDITT